MSRFRTGITIKPLKQALSTQSKIYFAGSCFAENMADITKKYYLPVLSNPFGIIYNPIAIADAFRLQLNNTVILPDDLILYNERYSHFNFHSKLSHENKVFASEQMNQSIARGNQHLKTATHLVITFGTAFAHTLKSTGSIVANNHKMPSDLFVKKLVTVEDIIISWESILQDIKKINPNLIVIFTISPVRHLREGAFENNVSKGILLQSVNRLISEQSDRYYFPAYEIMMDELRDYRFYAEDMLHPNDTAINHIWEKFIAACFDEKANDFFVSMTEINNAMSHHPFFEASLQHQQFRIQMKEKVIRLQQQYPEIDLTGPVAFFS